MGAKRGTSHMKQWNILVLHGTKLWESCGGCHQVSLKMGGHALDVMYRRFCSMVRKIVTQDKNSKMLFMVLNSLSDQKELGSAYKAKYWGNV